MFLRGAFGSVRQRPRAMAKPGGDDQSARRAQLSCLIDDACDGSGRCSNHHKFGYEWQPTKAADRGDAINVGIMRIDESKLAPESRLSNIVKNGPPDGASPRARPDQRERTRRKQIFQTIGRHQLNCPRTAAQRVSELRDANAT